MTLPRSPHCHAPVAFQRLGALLLALLLLTGLTVTAHAADFEIRRVTRAKEELVIYHDPVVAPGEVAMRVDLTRGGCDVARPPVNIRQAGDSFGTLIAIDRGDKRSLGKWSKDILGGVGDFLRAELMTQRMVPDEYALLDSYGTPPPREQPLTSSLPTLESFLSTAPEPEQAGAAIYRRTLDATRLLEATSKPLRAIVIVSDGADPNLYPGGVAEDTLLIERSKQLGAPIFAVVISREPLSKEHRAALQAAAIRLQSVAVRSGGGVIREVKADDNLRPNLAQALQTFAQTIGSWQRTDCGLCGEVTTGETAVELSALVGEDVIARSRQPYATKLTNVGDYAGCKQCDQASDCSCEDETQATCKDRECRCAGDCSEDADCPRGQSCRKGKCEATFPWVAVGVVGGFLVFVLLVFGGVLVFFLRSQAEDRRRREDEARRREDEARWKQREEEERKRREGEAQQRESEAQRHAAEAAIQQAKAEAAQRAKAEAVAVAPVTPFRLHAQSAGYADIPLADGVTVIGGDAAGVLDAVRHLPPGSVGYSVVLAGATISAKHAVMRVLTGAVSVTDLGSTNGTFVNGVRLAAHAIVELKPGDRVEFSRQVAYVLEATGVAGRR